MKPTRVWLGFTLAALGVFGVLDAAGVLDWDGTVGAWWPIAIIGWGITDMLGDRRVTVGGVVLSGVGLALLVDLQDWMTESVIWSVLLLLIGGVILINGLRGRAVRANAVPPTGARPEQLLKSGRS